MPKRTDIHKVLVIGSGPIVIGQAAEFDYAGTQACLALREEGYEVILVNSNPATIMTDTSIADKVYMEPLTLEYVARICRFERPDAIVPGIGGQTGLNLAMQLSKKVFYRNVRSNFWAQMNKALKPPRTGSCSKSFVSASASQSSPHKSPILWRMRWRRLIKLAIRSFCVLHLRWVEQAAALLPMKMNFAA